MPNPDTTTDADLLAAAGALRATAPPPAPPDASGLIARLLAPQDDAGPLKD